MGAPTYVQLNIGSGGALVAFYQDSTNPVGYMHQRIILETQTGTSDPAIVNVTNPLPIQGPAAALATATGNPLQIGGIYNSSAPTVASGQIAPLQVDASGNLCINIKAGAAAGGTSGTVGASVATVATPVSFSNGSTMQLGVVDGSGNLKVNIAAGGVPAGQDNATFTAGTTNGLAAFGVYNDGISALTSTSYGAVRLTSDRKQYVAVGASVSGGWTPYGLSSAASTNATSVKGSAGQLGVISVTNNGASNAYLKIYNSASAPTAGSGTPVQRYMIPAGLGNNIPLGGPLYFSAGIGFTITGGAADTDTTAVLLNQVQVNLGYA
jgi:hypothetical protein